jgi:hypothetical protein
MKPFSPFVERSVSFLVLWALVVSLQWAGGAYQSEFGGHPDEAAHFVTSIMASDYVRSGMPAAPMEFAKNFYAHYPRVAIGHFPPGFYILLGSWMSVFPQSRASAMVFQSLITAMLAFVLFVIIRKRYGYGWALGGAAFFALLPVVQKYTARTMSDGPLGLVCLLAGLVLINYIEKPRVRSALLYGLLAAFAILIKQAGLLLAFVVPSAIFLSWRPGLLKERSLWLAPIPVVVVCVPWILATIGLFHEAIDGGWGLEYSRTAAGWVMDKFVFTAGLTLIFASVFGYLNLGALALRDGKPLDPYWAVVISLPLGVFFIFTLVPIGGVESRYLIPAIPPMIVLGVRGLATFGSWFRNVAPAGRRTISLIVGVAVIAFDIMFNFTIPAAGVRGFRPIVGQMLEGKGQAVEVLISSDPNGEGALIAEAVMIDEERPSHIVHRASKMLAVSDWLGREYKLEYENTEDLGAFLRNSSIDWIVVDRSVPPRKRVAHHALLEETLLRIDCGYVEHSEIPVTRGGNLSDGTAIIFRRVENN